MKVGVSVARKGSSSYIHLHMTQQRLSEGQVKMNLVHSSLVTSFPLSKMLDLSMNQPGGFTTAPVSPGGSPAQSCHPKSCTTKKEKLPGLPDSDRKLFLTKLLGKGSRPVLMVLASMGEPSALQPRCVPQAAGPRDTFIPPPHPSAVPPWKRRGDKSAKGVAKASGMGWFEHQT